MKDDYLKVRLISIEQRLKHLEVFTGLDEQLKKLQRREEITEKEALT